MRRTARQAARNPDWQAEYRQHRRMVGRTIAWLIRGRTPPPAAAGDRDWCADADCALAMLVR
ncbi:MAG: hypothetical protein QOI75_6826 [Pseudonocardiales bacterium]|jgi:hypothetical protein|nr:hypothetical protein [Pseudonocardiales bacterium]